MVFNKFTHLARPSLSKTFAHGYAQSVVAATQSTTPFSPLGKHTQNKSSRPSTVQQHHPFSNVSATHVSSNKPAQQVAETTQSHDVGLKAYYEAWQKLQQHGGDGREWRQYQFPKAIEPKGHTQTQEVSSDEQQGLASRSDGASDRGSIDRAYSTSAVEDIKKAQDEAEEAAVAKVDEAIATVIRQINRSSAEPELTKSKSGPQAQEDKVKPTQRSAESIAFDSSISQNGKAETSSRSTPLSEATAATSVQSDLDSLTFSQQIKDFEDAEDYQGIPRAFEAMLSRGIKPRSEAYTALLVSATHLALGRLQVVPKALEIYSDMLRRKVSPNPTFYSKLIQILSHHALQVEEKRLDLGQESKRFSITNGEGRYILPSHATEHAILAEDDALDNAVKIFNTAFSFDQECPFPPETYQLLILACAQQQNVEHMVSVYQQLEKQKVTPTAAIFPAMIGAFASSGDLRSALECYDEYRSLAIADDTGFLSIHGRNDAGVYAALIKAYLTSGKSDGGQRFFNRIVESFAANSKEREKQLELIQDTVNTDAFVQHHLDVGNFEAALNIAESSLFSSQAKEQAYSKICIAAADKSIEDAARRAYQLLLLDSSTTCAASKAMIALHIRKEEIETASEYWTRLTATGNTLDPSFVTPAVSYVVALIRNNQMDKASALACEVFARIRASLPTSAPLADLADEIDEAIEVIANFSFETRVTMSAYANLNFLHAMMDNGGLIFPVAEQILKNLNLEQFTELCWKDMILLLQVQAGLLNKSATHCDPTHLARFDGLLGIALKANLSFDERTMSLLESATEKLSEERPDIRERWITYKQDLAEPANLSFTPTPRPTIATLPPLIDTYDPYGVTTDFKGSAVIIEELENYRNGTGLNEALMRFRNIRRGGRHPRYVAYAKLIVAAAKEGRINLTHDILGMARHDMPLLLQYPTVRHGWSSILDAMIGACLTAGRRDLAEQFHQELLEMGSAPTANTYGLYITTLKESTKTFDEATEAVRVFHRALSEGVLPSSFLYNALIGKLGKARRIDDCLRYFQEMRAAGIRPTSVTYGTIVNALCRVSDERFAEELFDEMESMPNYKPRPAPYNSIMQYFLTTKRDSRKVLAYYDRMRSMNIQPTMHTYKLLIDTYATLEPVNLGAAEGILDVIRAQGFRPEAVHYASLIHAKGCALHDMAGARDIFERVLTSGEVKPQPCLYQALFESMVANHCVGETEEVLDSMSANGVEMTPYIANTLIHGWAMENHIAKSKAIYDSVGMEKREPSTYESMTRAFLTADNRKGALTTAHEMLSRGYPSAVSNKILELLGHGMSRNGNFALSDLTV